MNENQLQLADMVMRESLRNPKKSSIAPWLGKYLKEARRFVLDASASSFLADLAFANFMGTRRRSIMALETSRRLARLPHRVTWIEYDSKANKQRMMDAYNESILTFSRDGSTLQKLQGKPDDALARTGWLIRTHPDHETLFWCDVFGEARDNALWLPFTYVWETHDEETLLKSEEDAEFHKHLCAVATGILGYHSPHIAISRNAKSTMVGSQIGLQSLCLMGGEFRRVLTLLAAINDIPVGLRKVEPSRGFIARGRYRKLLDHTVITLTLPKGRDPQKVARRIIALARKRAHQVRGHWRRNWRKDGDRIWIHEHWRGDVSLGVVTHDYNVEHEHDDRDDSR